MYSISRNLPLKDAFHKLLHTIETGLMYVTDKSKIFRDDFYFIQER